MQPAVAKRNDKHIKSLANQGVIGNYLYVSAKDGRGMAQLKQAIFDADIKNHGDRVRPYDPKAEKKRLQQLAANSARSKGSKGEVLEEDPEEQEHSSDSEGELKHAKTGAAGSSKAISDLLTLQKSESKAKGKDKNADDNVFTSNIGEEEDSKLKPDAQNTEKPIAKHHSLRQANNSL